MSARGQQIQFRGLTRRRAFALVCAFAVSLAGCDPFSAPDTLMDEYVERVGRVLDVPVAKSALPEVARLPRRRVRTRELPEIDIGILEFFSLYGCELQHVVGQKNSALGRVMQPVQRLRYELRFIQVTHDCLPRIDDESLQNDLAEALVIKRRALPRAIWNATWGAPEMDRFFTRSEGYLPLEQDADTLATVVTDLDRLNAWLQSVAGTETPEMVDGLSDIHQRWQSLPVAGQLVQSARLLIARLGDVENLLAQRLQGRPLCFNQRPNREAEIMRNLFFNVYAREVQPYMALVQRTRAQLIPSLHELARLQEPVRGAAFEPFYHEVLAQDAESVWDELDQAVRTHTEHWQDLLDQCGMRPQA